MAKKPKKSAAPSPSDADIARFQRSLGRNLGDDQRLGLAVSGGPDSMALLLLAHAALPGRIEAATVDHALRKESGKEAESVAAQCAKLGVPHEIQTVEWDKKPETRIQERARNQRYRLLADWANRKQLDVVATAHHANDQAETLIMRLVRGSGVSGLAGMRPSHKSETFGVTLIRPLLKWTRAELLAVCNDAKVKTVDDPSNADPKFERTRIRAFLDGADWLDPIGLGRSANYLGQADAALTWAARQEWERRVIEDGDVITLDHSGLPEELGRRIVRAILEKLRVEGRNIELRGREIDQLLLALLRGRRATLRGVVCSGGPVWHFTKAPERKATA